MKPLAFLAAAAALCLDLLYLGRAYHCQTSAQFIHNLAVVVWLTSNTTWMAGELLFEANDHPGGRFPWYHGPAIANSEYTSELCVHVAQFIMVMGLAMLLVFYAGFLAECSERRRTALLTGDETAGRAGLATKQRRVFNFITPEVYQQCFIGPWMAKDLAWTLETWRPALGFSMLVAFVSLDCLRRYKDFTFIVILMWVGGNTVWICGEVLEEDRFLSMRVVSAAILAVALFMCLAQMVYEWRK